MTWSIQNLWLNLLKIDKKWSQSIDIFYIRYITMKDSYCVNIHSVNALYFSIGEVDRYIEDKNGNKYLNVTSTDKNKEELTKYIGL